MNAGLHLALALGLDAALGDPRWTWHPVRLIGRLAATVERAIRQKGSSRAWGALGWLLVVSAASLVALGMVVAARSIHPACEAVVSVMLIYSAIAPRDLARHARTVEGRLEALDLPAARRAVGNLVGRDTEELDEAEISRAAVEAVAESTVDGVTAPLFYALLLGPVGAVAYRAINTLDSMWGHRDARYERFGWAAARADDIAGFVPARLTVFWITAAAALRGLQPLRACWRVAWRDGKRHPSPNSGLSEAAFAGALGVRLGGRNRYEGVWGEQLLLGDSERSASPGTIGAAVALMWHATWLCASTLVATALLVECPPWIRGWL